MDSKPLLTGRFVRLEPLERSHVQALAAASSGDRELYRWSPVPNGEAEAVRYIETAISWREDGTAVPFAVVRLSDNTVIGSTRFFLIERWAWPRQHPRQGRTSPDACEIGYTWYAHSGIRTPANTESKLLMLTHAFDTWDALRVCFHTDARNLRSQAALQRVGAKFEGVLRSHRMAADFIPRDSHRFSIVATEWPGVKERLQRFLEPR